ncbi:hypothetical protein [uncultured Tenacibaculum sp.]|uniref:hypothetical protein n=1 Tax=uncultured Tenacibaculum sp. TaxID=174713 RepID=UPI002604C0DE|nr:hypothetical protein [uncultured Tenacibaculum sp.]
MNVMLYTVLGIILFSIGKTFFGLAKKYRKNRFVFTIIGVLSFVVGVIIYILIYAALINILPVLNRYIHEYLSFAVGVLIAVLIHYLLEKKWKQYKNVDAEQAIDKIGEN